MTFIDYTIEILFYLPRIIVVCENEKKKNFSCHLLSFIFDFIICYLLYLILLSAIFYISFCYLLSFIFCLLSSTIFFGCLSQLSIAYTLTMPTTMWWHQIFGRVSVLSIWVEFNGYLRILFDVSKSTKKILKLEMKY